MFTLSLKRALTALVALSTLTDARPPCPPRDNQEWVTVWGAMPQLTEPQNLPPAPFNETGLVFRDTTIRQTVKVSLAASTIRLQISNVFGGSDLPITAVSVALPSDPSVAGTSGIQADTARKVTFSNATSFVVPPGALYVSDPITLEVEAESILAISIYLAAGQTTNAITSHPGSRTSSWLAHGNHVSDAELPSPVRTDHWFLISALEARLYKGASTFAIVGDSLTDGRGSTTNANNRWPDRLLARLQLDPATSQVAILNQAAGGNRVLNDGLGPAALGRIDRDVLAHSGVRYALLFIGINDIGTTASDEAALTLTAGRLEQAYAQMAYRIRRKGITVWGATLTPMTGEGQAYGTPEREAARQRVNAWIRTSGVFDAVVDFDEMVRDPSAPDQLAAAYDEGDHLHLNPAGYQAMADGFDVTLFTASSMGTSGWRR
ncbi:hypothetical protein D7B24_002095 [Verticillium nonalfalfae]|uniref:SGNH hydrolase-type esterase domain-containing protein n=1 Tax=Verticillium nonalfalfae TaxID=1051616 RepID=A0A3M9Y1H0_9PEZI|nr:uncharacterized protein D7B24_002095 [Verticillium nonalfalfae]RNJ53248.1 hypothetical protein D7B24_002095 [Verticillium nonalfalfae]